jgi:hypothetical protein
MQLWTVMLTTEADAPRWWPFYGFAGRLDQ